MAIYVNKKYDNVQIIDIPENEISEELKESLKDKARYQEIDGTEHLYNSSQVLESSDLAEAVIAELDSIEELCHNNRVIYFRIIEA